MNTLVTLIIYKNICRRNLHLKSINLPAQIVSEMTAMGFSKKSFLIICIMKNLQNTRKGPSFNIVRPIWNWFLSFGKTIVPYISYSQIISRYCGSSFKVRLFSTIRVKNYDFETEGCSFRKIFMLRPEIKSCNSFSELTGLKDFDF